MHGAGDNLRADPRLRAIARARDVAELAVCSYFDRPAELRDEWDLRSLVRALRIHRRLAHEGVVVVRRVI